MKNSKYYIKDGIKCSKRDFKVNLKNIKYSILDIIAGYWDLFKIKIRRRK